MCLGLILFSIFLIYGHENQKTDLNHLNSEDLNQMLQQMTMLNPSPNLVAKIDSYSKIKKCQKYSDICDSNNQCPETIDIDSTHFLKICPYIVKNAFYEDCQKPSEEKVNQMAIKKDPVKTWLLAIFTSLLVNLCALNGFLFISILKKRIFEFVIFFLLSLAIGVLLSNAILHLLPNSLEIEINQNPKIFIKFLFILVGIYAFLVIEITLKVFLCKSKANEHEVVNLCHHLNPSEEYSPGTEPKEDLVIIKKNKSPFYKPVFMSRNVSSSALLILLGDLIHNLIDGLVIGASYSESTKHGIFVSIPIFLEEFTHELGDYVILLNSGMTTYQAIFWNGIVTITNIIGCVIGLWVGTNKFIVSIIEAFCCGMFLYISMVVMLPEVITKTFNLSDGTKRKYMRQVFIALVGILLGFLIMIGLSYSQNFLSI